MGRIEVDQHRYDLKAPIDSEKPSKGSAGYLKLRHFEAEETVSMRRDRSGDPEDVREARHPLGRGHHARVHEPRVIAGSPPPPLSPLTPVSQVSVHPEVRNCSCDVAQANVQAALLASGDGNNEGAPKSLST